MLIYKVLRNRTFSKLLSLLLATPQPLLRDPLYGREPSVVNHWYNLKLSRKQNTPEPGLRGTFQSKTLLEFREFQKQLSIILNFVMMPQLWIAIVGIAYVSLMR